MKLTVLDGEALNPGDLSWEPIARFGTLTVYPNTAPEELLAHIGDSDVVMINKVHLDGPVFDACPRLKLVCVLATGYNVVDVQAARAHGVSVCNIPAYSTHAVAQMTIALLLEICLHVGAHDAACHSGQWENCPNFCFWNTPLIELAGKTLGIIGYGAIGQSVGAVAQALGMRLLVNARHVRPELEHAGCRYASLDELLAQSDVITLHCPLTAENAGLIDAAALAKMKDGAILLNTARGGLLDEQAVADALVSGKLRAAGLDVVTEEPILPDNPLLHAPSCILTPHIAWAPLETRQRLLRILQENLEGFVSGRPVNVVN